MPIQANVTNNQITATVGESKIDVAVSGGFGPSGAAGAAGQAATITVGTVTTGAPGSSASVVNAGSSSAAVLNFTIPAGATGATGPQGATGPAGTTTWAGITDKPATFAPSAHTHDDRYYTETEVDTLLAGKQATGSYVLTTDARLSDARQPLTHTHTASQISDFTSAVIAAAPPTTNASLLTSGTLPDARLSANIARTSDITAGIASVVNAAPASLDTLKELADALGNDASFSATVTNALAAKAPIASPTFTGTVSGVTKAMVGLGNVPNVDATARANHTGTQPATTITGLAAVATSGAYADLSGTPAAYSLPTASSTVTGGVRIGSGVSIDGSGVISVSVDYAATLHSHGNLSASGIMASGTVAANVVGGPVVFGAITGAIGRGAFGTVGGTFCQGNDSRLSDARTPTAHNQAWSTITSTPTTLSGYGITDAVSSTDARLTDARTPLAHNQAWSTITATPTTLAGYGITDAAALSHTHSALSPATASTLGTIIVGSGLSVTSGTVSANVTSVAGRTGAVTIAAADVSGLGSLATQSSVAYSSLTGTPSTFAPSAHKSTHATGGSDALSASDIGAAASSHTHGNLTNAGAIGSTSGLPIITTTSGVLTTGTFGTTSGTFCRSEEHTSELQSHSDRMPSSA